MTADPSDGMFWRGWSIYIDANVFIYAMENDDPLGASARRWFEQLDLRAISGVTSELTALEVLPSAMRGGDTSLTDEYRRVFDGRSVLRVVAITSDILAKAIDVRAALGGQTVDALHVATALTETCEAILTNDERLKTPPGLIRLGLADIERADR